jgi:hypothetical protein
MVLSHLPVTFSIPWMDGDIWDSGAVFQPLIVMRVLKTMVGKIKQKQVLTTS